MSDGYPTRPAHPGRIVLDTFRSAGDPMLRSWLGFREQLLPDSASVSSSRPGATEAQLRAGRYGVWRILATNNRELARCARLLETPEAALADVHEVRRVATDLTAFLVRGSHSMTHAWVLRSDGVPVVTASRWYESASEAASAAKAARRVLVAATVVDGVSMGTNSGRRHRRAIAPVETHG